MARRAREGWKLEGTKVFKPRKDLIHWQTFLAVLWSRGQVKGRAGAGRPAWRLLQPELQTGGNWDQQMAVGMEREDE